jgi:hypothetical protein
MAVFLPKASERGPACVSRRADAVQAPLIALRRAHVAALSCAVVKTIVMVAALLAGACGARTDHASTSARTGVAWRQLGTWSGRGSGQTGSFTSETGALRVRWEATDSASRGDHPADSTFRVAAHSAISGRLLQPVVEHAGAGSGVGYVQQDPHVFFMVVESRQLSWTLTVDEAVGYP